MGRSPCCAKEGLNRGAWTASEDKILSDYIKIHGEGRWRSLPKRAGLKRCGKSCRLRWLNYLRPDIKRGNISHEEEELIIRLHKLLGNRWSLIAGRLPGRTDNEIKNYWNTNLGKRVKNQTSQPSYNKNLQKKKAVIEPSSGGVSPPKIESKAIRTKAMRCTKVFFTPPLQQMVNNLNENAVAEPSIGGEIETLNGTNQVPSRARQDNEDSPNCLMNLDMDEHWLSELLSSDYFHDTDSGIGEDVINKNMSHPCLLNHEMEDWSGVQRDISLDVASFLNMEDWLTE